MRTRAACARARASSAGDRAAAASSASGDRGPRALPTAIALPGIVRVARTTREHTCAILDDGRLLCWGMNLEGQLGRGDTYPGADGLSPREVAGTLRWAEVAPGQGHTCAIATDGTLHCWGRNTDSELGLGPGAMIQLRTPQPVGRDADWIGIACGQHHSCGIRAGGTLWCWGSDFHGQVGIARDARFDVPTQVGTEGGWAQVSTYVFHTCAVRDDGTLWCWGRNDEGQLGLGDTLERGRPTRVGDRTDWAEVSVGWFHTCAQRRDGSVWCAGENRDGRLGVGDVERRSTLTQAAAIVE